MRNLTTSLSLLALLMPVTAFAQEAVTLDEIPEEEAAPAPAPAPAEAPAEPAAEPAPGEAAPAGEPVQLEETGGTADASASTSAGFQASGTTEAAPLAPAPAAATAPVAEEAGNESLTRPGASTFRGPGGSDDWGFSYSGYFRAPMRVGIGTNQGLQHRAELGNDQNPDGNVVAHSRDETTGDWNVDGTLPKKMDLHLPLVPDAQYGGWQNTNHQRNDWAEMFFSVGNGTVSGTLALQAFQFTDASWKEDGAQFGIGQGWIEINSDLGFENVRFNTKVGSHWARYGMAGIYDAGEFDTYLFGRTHTMGATSRIDLILSSFDLGIEGGFGTKRPDPEMFNRSRFTLAGHGHVFLTFPSFEFSLNAMHAWSNTSASPSYPNVLPGSGGCNGGVPGAQCTTALDDPDGMAPFNQAGVAQPDGTQNFGGVEGPQGVWGAEYPTGTQTIVGGDARMDFGLLGYLYAGYSHQFLKNALVVDSAIESIHSFGGGMFNLGVTDNYLESAYCSRSGTVNESCSNGTGSVGTVMFQYELGLANFGILPGGMDLKTKLYGMVNFVSVDDIEKERLENTYSFYLPGGSLHDTLAPEDQTITIDDLRQDGVHKKKFGADLEFFALDWMSVGLRGDWLDPNSKLDKEGFTIISPRLTFRSKAVTHEKITLQYSRYIYQQRHCEDDLGNIASPADDPFRTGTLFNQQRNGAGYPLRVDCVNPGPSPVGVAGWGQHSNGMAPGQRGAPSLSPDENVITLEASMWW